MAREIERAGAEILVDVVNEVGVEYILGHTVGAVIPVQAEVATASVNILLD